jgi:hypothetical protein
MIVRILYRVGKGWFWRLEYDNGTSICWSENHRSMDGGYTRKSTAIASAWRFIDRCLDSTIRVEIRDRFTQKFIGGRNLG